MLFGQLDLHASAPWQGNVARLFSGSQPSILIDFWGSPFMETPTLIYGIWIINLVGGLVAMNLELSH